MKSPDLDVVTGAFGQTGKYIARRLLAMGKRVRTLTNHPRRPDPFGGQVEVAPLAFDDPAGLARSLRGATTFYNTYWIRFPDARMGYGAAVENTKMLVRAAGEAGVRRLVHISVTNASEASPLPYFRGKGDVERGIMCSALSYAIIRPTLVFGAEDILVNNIAWCLRHLPVFALPGAGDYRVQPVFAGDVAEIAVEAAQWERDAVLDAVGQETFGFAELVGRIRENVGSRARIVRVAPALALLLARGLGWAVKDVLLTRDELRGLMANLLVSEKPPTGATRFSDWMAEHAGEIGVRYASELDRHYR